MPVPDLLISISAARFVWLQRPIAVRACVSVLAGLCVWLCAGLPVVRVRLRGVGVGVGWWGVAGSGEPDKLAALLYFPRRWDFSALLLFRSVLFVILFSKNYTLQN